MLDNYGNIVKDSVESMCSVMNDAFLSKTFFVPSVSLAWIPENISFNDKLKSILKGATTRTDSIDNICHWIASRYPFGDPDVDTNFANRSIDSTWNLMDQGNLSGLCGEFSVFFAKIVESHFPAWGIPVRFFSAADTSLTQGGRGLPSHVWVGLAHENGEVYAVCDPTLGGVVKDRPTGKLLSLKEVMDFLRNPENAFRPYIQTVISSFQTYGPLCVPYIMLIDRETPIYYNTPIEIVEGHWRGLDASSSHCAPYWSKRGFPRATYMNVYLDMNSLAGPEYANDTLQKVREVYLPSH